MNKDNKFQFKIRTPLNQIQEAETIDVDIYGVVMNGADYWGEDTGVSNVLSQLQGLDPSQNIVLHVNSVGGEVSAGVTIYNRLRALQNKKSIIIEGLAASIASIISMAGDEIHMALGSEMMIHNPSSYAFGEADDFEKAAESLRKTKENLIDIYEARTGLTREEIATMMDEETWLTAREALEKGFCTSVDESLQMVACRKGTDLIVNGLPMSMEVLKGLPVDKYEEKGEEPMEVTAELLRTDYAEVYDEVFNAGVAAERARLQALDGINNEARAEVVNRAKYETYATVQDVAVELLNMPQPEPSEQTNQFQRMIQDANNASNKVNTVPGQVLDEDIDEADKTMKIVDRVMKARVKK
jgi:ATP-dependent Clp endopeptidase proteolytic subunit ClpP|nr:MAG TPA: Putative ATP dependent Clp protease [Caudoviricetes sp.]